MAHAIAPFPRGAHKTSPPKDPPIPPAVPKITAIPTLLEKLELTGCIITIDAMGTQKDIAKIIAEENDYVLALMGNHGDLFDDVKTYFELENLPVGISTLEKDHGRIEKREYFLETEIDRKLSSKSCKYSVRLFFTVQLSFTKPL